MIDFFLALNPVIQAIVATLFTWGMTALGAALVFTTKSFNQKLLDGMLGFAGGVMIATSFWSFLSPALEMAEGGVTGLDTGSGWFYARRSFPVGD